MKQRIIFHIDLDAFFAACEVLKNPSLRGKSVVVGADPKSGKGRGVVSTASYEARALGIRSGQPISKAYQLSQNRAVFLPTNFEFYEKKSRAVMKIFKKYADKFECGGIDEAYLEVTSRAKNFSEAKFLAQKIQDEVFEKTKLTCSVGIAANKMLAKIGSGFKKPKGLTCILPEKALDFLAPLKCRELMGVGPKTEQKLLSQNIRVISDLRKFSREKLVALFGKSGANLYDAAWGIDESEVEEGREQKSISAEQTFEIDTKNPYFMIATLNKLARQAADEVEKNKLKFKQIAIKVRFMNFQTYTRQCVLPEFSDKFYDIKMRSHELFKPFLQERRKIRLLGVKVGQLESA